jgi:hypothetical protein
MHAPARLVACFALACCSACSPPAEPPDERPPEPQAAALHDAVQAPLAAARSVGDTVQDAARHRTSAADAADAAPVEMP